MSEMRIDPTQLPLQVGVQGTVPVSSTPTALQLLHTSGTPLAVASSEESAWVNVETVAHLFISRATTGGTYGFEVDWSRDGVAVDLTEVVTVADDTSVERRVAAKFARFRVRNTDAAVAFTAHRTNVYGR